MQRAWWRVHAALFACLLLGVTPLSWAQSATLVPASTVFAADGGSLTLTATITYSTTPTALGFAVNLPDGWSYASGVGEPAIRPDAGTTGLLEWAYTSGYGATSSSFTFTVNYPAGQPAQVEISASALYRSPLSNLTVASLVLTRSAPQSAPAFTQQPVDRAVTEGGGTTFSVAATGVPSPTLRWQRSTDGGTTWTDLAEGGQFSGVGTATLTVANVAVAQSGSRFRALASNSVQADVASSSGLLTVVPAGPTAALVANTLSLLPGGGTVTLTASILYPGEPSSLGFLVELPAGWAYQGGTGEPAIKPDAGSTGTLEWAYSSGFGTGGSSFSFTVSYPAGLGASQTVTSSAIYRSPLANLAISPLVFTAPPAPLAAWRAQNFTADELANPAISGPDADPDRDGRSNLLEYALGSSPKLAGPAESAGMSAGTTEWIYSYTRPADRTDVVYAVEASTNLTQWFTVGVVHERVSTASGTETWQARYPRAGAAQLYFRLKVAVP